MNSEFVFCKECIASDELLIRFIMAIVWDRLSTPSSLVVAQSNLSNTLSIDRIVTGFFDCDLIDGFNDACSLFVGWLAFYKINIINYMLQ